MNRNGNILLIALLGIVIGVLLSVTTGKFYSLNRKFDGDYNRWRKLNLILEQVEGNYVDTIDMKKMTDAAVVAALSELDPHSVYLPPVDLEELLQGVSLQDLKRVFLEVLARKEEKVDRVRSDFGVIKRERISLSARIGSVLNYTRKHRNFSFRQMLGQAEGRMEVVVTFLALLELMKMGKVQVCQKDTFSDIEVHATKETDTEDLDLRDLEDV